MMLTNPNTLGLFEEEIDGIDDVIHAVGGLAYDDGANLNAIMGRVPAGPHGVRHRPHEHAQDIRDAARRGRARRRAGGRWGSGWCRSCPVSDRGALPSRRLCSPWSPTADRDSHRPDPRIPRELRGARPGVLCTCSCTGGDGLQAVSERAVLNANYLASLVRHEYPLAFPDGPPMHESCRRPSRAGATACGRWTWPSGSDRPRVPSVDGVLPPGRGGGHDGRAHRDRVEAGAGRGVRGGSGPPTS